MWAWEIREPFGGGGGKWAKVSRLSSTCLGYSKCTHLVRERRESRVSIETAGRPLEEIADRHGNVWSLEKGDTSLT